MARESRYNIVGNQLITESGQDKRVQNYLKQNGYSDYNQRMELIGSIKHDIPNLRLDNNKFYITLQGELVFPNIWFDEVKVCPLMVTYHNKDNQVVQAELDNNGNLYNEQIVDGSKNESKRFSLYGSKIIVTESQFKRLMRNITRI